MILLLLLIHLWLLRLVTIHEEKDIIKGGGAAI